jgi:tRNA threonylcarbamoyladenosine biosynthesis protein TsaE
MSLIKTQNEEQTAAFAAEFAAGLGGGSVVCLWGDLGVGKSVFCRSIIRSLCADPWLEVPSPTFTLVQVYETPKAPLWHFDLYRLSEPGEVYETGWEEALARGIVLVEWPGRLGVLLPDVRIDVTLHTTPEGPDFRAISIIPHGTSTKRTS